jgi:AcrR family transcriptional regulator
MRARILEAAERVIREQGAAAATTREIARAAGCAEGSIYVHFEDKAGLLVALVIEQSPQFARLLELPQYAGTATVRENLEEAATLIVELLQGALPLLAGFLADPGLMARYAAQLQERQAGPYQVLAALRAYIRAEQRKGRIDAAADPAAAASLVVAACRGFALSELMLRDLEPATGKRFPRQLARTLVAGLEPRPGRA